MLQAQLNRELSHVKGFVAIFDLKSEKMTQIKLERDNLLDENAELKEKICEIEQFACKLSYDDLIISEHMIDFTFFPSFVSVDPFLEFINCTQGSELGDGLYENLVTYSNVYVDERKMRAD